MHLLEITLARWFIWQILHVPEYYNILPKLHFPENLFSRIYIWWKYISPKTYFQKLYKLVQNFAIGRI